MFFFCILLVSAQSGFSAGLKLIKSRDDELCEYMQTIFQKDFDQYGSEQFSLHEEYNWIKWTASKYLLKGGLHPQIKKVLLSKFDINNDGRRETVSLETVMIFARETDELHVLGDDTFNINKELEFTINELIKMPGIIASAEWPYRLDIKSLDVDYEFYKRNSILSLIDIYPFKINGALYLSLVEKYQVKNQPKWHVIVKYTDEQFPIGRGDRRSTSKLEHICYFDSISSKRER